MEVILERQLAAQRSALILSLPLLIQLWPWQDYVRPANPMRTRRPSNMPTRPHPITGGSAETTRPGSFGQVGSDPRQLPHRAAFS
jgi:hypothetical protein